ncbi:MAG: molybdopterin-dependent oxidoreductase, partial [Dehalococcoidia bacterium]|nr:molybdopterin-dependent oxidoreductase [Dehalococcoidia bacterium]
MSEFTCVGQGLPMVDAAEKAIGAAQYSGDIRLPGMLWGKILRSPFPHARILNIDTSRAERLPGVRAVVTSADAGKVKYGLIVPDELALASGKVRYVGEEVAAVAAVDEELAAEALQLIRVDYEELPAVLDPLEAMEPGAPLVHDTKNVASRVEIRRGDPEKGMEQADHVFEDKFVIPIVHPGYMEPSSCVASFDPSGKLTLWVPCQAPFIVRPLIASALGLSLGNVRMIQTYIGGGFGGKVDQRIYPICGLLARKSGRPVKITMTRKEDLSATKPCVPMIIYLKTGVKKDGTFLAKDTRIIG